MATVGEQRPRIIAVDRQVRAGRKERLDGEHQSIMDAAPVVRLVPGWNVARLFMQRRANAMAREIADQGVAVLVGETLDGAPDLVELRATSHDADAAPQRTPA